VAQANSEVAREGHVVADRYHLVKLLGAGGMGSVYEARNSWTNRRVAVKFLRPELIADRDAVLRFLQEAQAAAAIAHPNIIEVLDMGKDPVARTLYIVHEFLAGLTLRQRMGKGLRISLQETLDIALPIMGALCAAHRRSIIHRDLKPENIFLCKDATGARIPKLIDFGVIKMKGLGAIANQTTTGFTVGTPRYMSPEQLAGDRTIDGRSDVWSMGVVLYEMLSGRQPFKGDTIFELARSILEDRPAALDETVAKLNRPVAAAIDRALRRDPDERFADMRQFVDALVDGACLDDPERHQSLMVRHARALQEPEPPSSPSEVAGLAIPEELLSGTFEVAHRAEPKPDAAAAPAAPKATARRTRAPKTTAPEATARRKPGRRAGRALVFGMVALVVLGAAVLVRVALRPGPGPVPASAAP
jgi:serine/threonine-protein kinase